MAEPRQGDAALAGRPRAVLLDVMPQSSRETLRTAFGDAFDFGFASSGKDDERIALVGGATVLLSMWGTVDHRLIDSATEAKVIQKLGVGTDKIDLEAAANRGIAVLKAAGINAEAVGEATVMLALAVSRHLLKAVRDSRAGRFEKEALRAATFQLVGRTVGLFGLGHIGRAAARRFNGFGVELIYHDLVRASGEVESDYGARYVSFEELLDRSDILSLHVPSTPQTSGMINAQTLARMKPTAILVNTARGSLVDERALAGAIARGELLGAGLDVTAEEPLDPSSPLFELDRVIVTPHIGGAVGDNFPRVAARAFDNVTALLAGREVRAEDVVVAPRAPVSG